ncbi:tetratricopeptide repeat protein, partial [Candidatus Magnetaquicoccus inordinatus]|uniref:tetratricopeptide repeat protein n=1 Tax=Candidatus Magnetaquicoccus inordinatus TaxID=2496818 RepID=UPI00102AA706
MPTLSSQENSLLTSEQLLALYRRAAFLEAFSLAEQLLRAFPGHPALLACAGDCALRLAWSAQNSGEWERAESFYRRLLAIDPHHPEALFRLACLLQEQQQQQDAEKLYRQLLACQPQHPEAWYNLANLLKQDNRLPEALESYQEVIRQQADHARAWNNRGLLLQSMQQMDAAKQSLQEAIRLAPQQVDYWINLGNLLHKTGDNSSAETIYCHALTLQPQHAVCLCNLGIVLSERQRLPEAEQCYRAVLQLHPEHSEARWNLSLLLLRQERYAEGWEHYEARLLPERRQTALPSWPFPQWQGESLHGLSLLLLCEQGFGDTIHFCRYITLLRRLGVRHVTLLCPAPLAVLLQSLPAVDQLLVEDEGDPPPHDYWLFLMSLPYRLGATVPLLPSALPYLTAPIERLRFWQNLLPADRLHIGVIWRGSPLHKNDQQRSLPSLRVLAPLWQISGVT